MSTPAPVTPPTPAQLQSFVNLSALLTGIAADKLAPGIDPKNMKQVYYVYASAQDAEVFKTLMSIFDANATQPPATIANIIFNQSGTAIALFARSIMLMWYLGSWYPPEQLEKSGTGKPPPDSTVISSAAYTQGWAWNVAQAHPMGFSNFTFGYWASNPPALVDFVGGPSK
jgi:hypothetical protein